MRHLLGVGTNRGHSMIGLGLGLGLSEFRLPTNSFDPTKISGIKFWWSPWDATTLFQSDGGAAAVADGDPIGKIADKSGNGFHLIQASGTSKPALKTNIKNSRNVIRFDGVNDMMTVPSSTATLKFLHSQASTVFVVFRINTLSGTNAFFDSCDGSSGNVGSLMLATAAGSLGMRAARTGASYCFQQCFSGLFCGGWLLVCSRFKNDPGNATVANRSYGYKNTGSAFNNNADTAAVSTANATYDLTFGRTAVSGGTYLNADIGDVIAYDSALSDLDAAKVDAWINSVWGVY